MEPSSDFFLKYLEYKSGTEVPATFNRWSSIGMVGAWLGRQVYVKFGESKLYPNQYIKLMGSPGTKKSTAIKGAKRLLSEAGYDTFAGEKISKEKYLLDLGTAQGSGSAGDLLDSNLWDQIIPAKQESPGSLLTSLMISSQTTFLNSVLLLECFGTSRVFTKTELRMVNRLLFLIQLLAYSEAILKRDLQQHSHQRLLGRGSSPEFWQYILNRQD